MPHHKRPMIKGNLYITFKIELPPDNFADEKAYDVSVVINYQANLSIFVFIGTRIYFTF